jgi:hypothetical protein
MMLYDTPPIQLDPTQEFPPFLPQDWRFDEGTHEALHTPTQTLFRLYWDKETPDDDEHPEHWVRAIPWHVFNGLPTPDDVTLTELARQGIYYYLVDRGYLPYL